MRARLTYNSIGMDYNEYADSPIVCLAVTWQKYEPTTNIMPVSSTEGKISKIQMG